MDEKTALEYLENYYDTETDPEEDLETETLPVKKSWAEMTEEQEVPNQEHQEDQEEDLEEDQEPVPKRPKKFQETPCAFKFSTFGCRLTADKCKYSHDTKHMEDFRGVLPTVRKCQNSYCSNSCMGKLCSPCVRFQLTNSRDFVSNYKDKLVRLCPTPGCVNTCKGRVCRSCHFKYYSHK